VAQPGSRVTYRIDSERREEFSAKGFRPGHVFPHNLRFLPKAGPDGYKLAQRMTGDPDPDQLWEIVLYAHESMLTEFPEDVFFDDDIVWHQQQFGLPGQVATANVVLQGDILWSMVHISDLVQRIGRRRDLKTRIENRFRGWHDMLLNGLLAFAAQHGVTCIRLPRSNLAMRNTDPSRTVQRELFERVYDRDPGHLYRLEEAGDWWTLDLGQNRSRLVEPRRESTAVHACRRVCICHDIERNLGHEPSSRLPEQDWQATLARMLDVERRLGVKATYNVVGVLLEQVREQISSGGHCLAFHSFDHQIGRLEQLPACRRLDYRLKGYRPPQSVITAELTDERLLLHNFEWIASSERSLGISSPTLLRRLVRVPVNFDDFSLYKDGTRFEDWEAAALRTIGSRDIVVFTLHDCYAPLWRDRYEEFLERVLPLGQLQTVDELSADLTLAAAV
jgi:hypothetical protein